MVSALEDENDSINFSIVFQPNSNVYTKLLFEAASGMKSLKTIEVKTTLEKENGCPFAHRCPKACDKCFEASPSLDERSKGHIVRCWFDQDN